MKNKTPDIKDTFWLEEEPVTAPLEKHLSSRPRRPYWKRMHRDWKFWLPMTVLLTFMLFLGYKREFS